ncbi:MAG: transposase [Pirellulales bacterium]|nr:transposase [Pirellulales bacterium]
MQGHSFNPSFRGFPECWHGCHFAKVLRHGPHRRSRGNHHSLLPLAKHGGWPRTVNLRVVVNTFLPLHRSGSQWDMLPHDLQPKSTACEYFAQWRNDSTLTKMVDALRTQVRRATGTKPRPAPSASTANRP